MIDLNAALQVLSTENDDVLNVRVVDPNLGGDYPILAIVGHDVEDPDDQTIVRFSTDGESRKGKYTLQNVPEVTEADESGAVRLPASLVLKVSHPRYGTGVIKKVRAHDTKGVLVRFDDKANPVWVKHAKLTAVAA